ncbi:MAG: cytochrome c1 [Burkholderiales bacterium]
MKKIILILLAAIAPAVLAAGGGHPLDRAPKERFDDMQSLQRGAQLFVNYCLSCHGLQSMRYNRLKDIGIADEQVRNNLLFSAEKVGELMTTSMTRKDGKDWFGATPPDLSVIARARGAIGNSGAGADWLYTYLRTFYRDAGRDTGWNNLVYPNVGMPHVLYELQGEQAAKFVKEKDPHDAAKTVEKFEKFEIVKPGRMNKLEYDNAMADLVAFLVWVAEPVAAERRTLGIWVLLFLGLILFPCAWMLNRAYWKDIH